MKYITKFEAEQRAEQLEKRWGFGVFDDDKDKGKAEKKNPPMPNNVARKLVASYIEDETFGEIEELVHKHLAKHVDKTGGVKDYDSSYTSDLYRDFERQIVMPSVHSLADLDNAEAEGYSPFNPKNWKNDDTAQVWSLIEMDSVVDDMWNTMKGEAEDSRSSSARLETRAKGKVREFIADSYEERGRWTIEVSMNGKTVYSYDSDKQDDLESNGYEPTEDGWMKGVKDYSGLANWMEHLGVMEKGEFLSVVNKDGEKHYARSSPARLETRELDSFNEKHLRKWIESTVAGADEFTPKEIDVIYDHMMDTYNKDPEFWADQGWRALGDEVEVFALASKLRKQQ